MSEIRLHSESVEEALQRASQDFQLLTCGSDIGAFSEGLKCVVQDLKARGDL